MNLPANRRKLHVAVTEVDLQVRVSEYLESMDWDLITGKPSQNKLIELGLKDVAHDLYK